MQSQSIDVDGTLLNLWKLGVVELGRSVCISNNTYTYSSHYFGPCYESIHQKQRLLDHLITQNDGQLYRVQRLHKSTRIAGEERGSFLHATRINQSYLGPFFKDPQLDPTVNIRDLHGMSNQTGTSYCFLQSRKMTKSQLNNAENYLANITHHNGIYLGLRAEHIAFDHTQDSESLAKQSLLHRSNIFASYRPNECTRLNLPSFANCNAKIGIKFFGIAPKRSGHQSSQHTRLFFKTIASTPKPKTVAASNNDISELDQFWVEMNQLFNPDNSATKETIDLTGDNDSIGPSSSVDADVFDFLPSPFSIS